MVLISPLFHPSSSAQHIVFFDRAVTIGLQILVVYSDPAQEIDFHTILELAQKQVLQKERLPTNDDKYESTSKEELNRHYGSLSSHEILQLIQKSTLGLRSQVNSDKSDYKDLNNEKEEPSNMYSNKKRNAETYGYYDRYEELNENKIDQDYKDESNVQLRDKYKEDEERYKHNRFNELALEELLTKNVLEKQYKDKPRKLVLPSNLVGAYDQNNDKSDNSGYSKVYVILNPQAIEKSKNKDELNRLLVKILSLTASSLGKEQGKRIKERRYKGFPVKAGLLTRRARRDSREMFGGKDAEEEEYKPKRPRSERGSGGGGGGGGGRTAIPYIRHRGDIYERDN